MLRAVCGVPDSNGAKPRRARRGSISLASTTLLLTLMHVKLLCCILLCTASLSTSDSTFLQRLKRESFRVAGTHVPKLFEQAVHIIHLQITCKIRMIHTAHQEIVPTNHHSAPRNHLPTNHAHNTHNAPRNCTCSALVMITAREGAALSHRAHSLYLKIMRTIRTTHQEIGHTVRL